MPKYIVVVKVHERHFRVEALNEKVAKSKVESCAEDVEDLDFSEWIYNLKSDSWTAEEALS
jgi:hypothetical protein